MGEYAYSAPTSVAEAVAMLKEHASQGVRTQILAGGTDLLVQLQGLDKEPRTIVDVKKIDDVNRLEIGAEETFIGSAIPSAILNENDQLKAESQEESTSCNGCYQARDRFCNLHHAPGAPQLFSGDQHGCGG